MPAARIFGSASSLCCFLLVKSLLWGFVITETIENIKNSVAYVECEFELDVNKQLCTFQYRGGPEYIKMGAEVWCGNNNMYNYDCIELIATEAQRSCEAKALDPAGAFPLSAASVSRAVVVEPRCHRALLEVTSNVCEKLNLPITIMHGIGNIECVREVQRQVHCVDRLVNLYVSNLNASSYNELLVSEERFWDQIGAEDTESVLIFQTDSGICGPGGDIAQFAVHHYCGGAWPRPFITGATRVSAMLLR